nr:hypothetical protein [Tanacetum cinerariifolium]
HRSTVVGKQSTLDMGRVWIGAGPGLDRVWAGSAMCHATCQPRGIHVDADVDNMPYVGIDPELVLELWNFNKLGFNVRLFVENLLPDLASNLV